MRLKLLLCFLFSIIYTISSAQSDSRIKITAISSNINTGQNYSSWLSDDLSNLVPSIWSTANNQYADVTLSLESKSYINRLLLYDYEGVFTDNPVTIYAVNGTQKTLLGTFTGAQYKVFVTLATSSPILADAIIIHKYANGIPQKIQVFGNTAGAPPTGTPAQAVITFNPLPDKVVGNTAFALIATSSDTSSPVSFISSDTMIVSVANTNNGWLATIISAGTATITALQPASNNFAAATPVANTFSIVASQTTTNIKIPVDGKRWFQLTNASNSLESLFDANIDTELHTGWGKVIDNYDSYYPIINGEQIDLSGIRMYDGIGTTTSQPVTISVITNSGQKILVATFTGSQYKTWVGPNAGNPTQFNLPVTYSNIRYLVINSWNNFPTEIEFYGNYTAGTTISTMAKKKFPLKNMFGINGFEWNFEAPNYPTKIDPLYFKAAKTFTGFRHYMDWEKLESTEGGYSFNPTLSGGWNYDAIYDSCKAAGIEVLGYIKTMPLWLMGTYPAGAQDADNVPVRYGNNFTDPASYLEQAKAAFQYAARYGSNSNINSSLVSVNSTKSAGGGFFNAVKIGLGTVHYIECDNERDKWWEGRRAYQTAFEYAANLSAFYDGNKNTMGPAVGIKNADPNMQVVMGGTALATTDYIKGMVDWCRQNRGFRPDGSVDVCWDVINYHLYSNDAKSSQGGNATRGAAPEVSGAATVAAGFIESAHKYVSDMPVWVTELGYDVNQGSPYKAIAIGNKTVLQTQADWSLRSSLLYARTGVERIFFYKMYDSNPDIATQFSSCGLLNADKSRKPAADYLYQTNKLLGNYVFDSTISNDPFVDRYILNGDTAYAIVVPDETGRVAPYTLSLGNATQARVYTPTIGTDSMAVQQVAITNGALNIIATETPLFIKAVPVSQAGKIATSTIAINNLLVLKEEEQKQSTVNIFPNPAADYINVHMVTNSNEKVTLRIFEAASGKVIKTTCLIKIGQSISSSVNIKTLSVGYYMAEIKQGNNTFTKGFVKSY